MADKPIQIADTKTIAAPIYANPAAVGLGAFASTTLLLQFHNLGWATSSGVVMWLAFFFGGLAQLIAGFQEFKTGNNFGFAAFVTYGSFWLALGGIFLTINLNLFKLGPHDIGYFLIIFTVLTFIYLFGAMRQNFALATVFFSLLVGYILLDVYFLGGSHAWLTAAGYELMFCAASAYYLMAHVVLTPLGLNIPAGKPWMK
jgi:succinate-acetate transporter protein